MFTATELIAATGGCWSDNAPALTVDGVFTDTRVDGKGKLFIALAGEKFDAHDFLDKAIAANAAMLCIQKDKKDKLSAACPIPVLLVSDTVAAYQNLGRFHRLRFPQLKVAAVTGSVGKTSAKEMLRAIFEAAAGAEHVLYTLGNTNNQIGVPQNLLRLTANHRYAVIECGTNHHGEIEPLSRCACPQAAVVNSIAPCHLEFLGDLDGVAREKSHIFDGLPAVIGTAIIPRGCAGHEVLLAAAEPYTLRQFGNTAGCDVWSVYHGGNLTGSSFTLHFADGQKHLVNWQLTGRHQSVNAAGAAAAALALGISPADIAKGLANTTLPGMRMKQTRYRDADIINDAYNANPGSMAASIEWLAEFADESKLLLVLGEMRELGAAEAAGHREIYELAVKKFPKARIVLIGKAFAGHHHTHFTAANEAFAKVDELIRPGDIVFAKGSRGIAVELALPECAR